MKILVRDNKGAKWKRIDGSKYSGEAHLRDIIHDDAAVIPVEDIDSSIDLSPEALMLKEVGLPGSSSSRATDLVGIDKLGNIFIVETKLASNPQAKREVIGQILEYAAFMHEKRIDWLNEVVKKQKGMSVAEYFEKVPEWDKESFEQKLRDTLNDGKFKLFIAVDEMNPALQTIINYMRDPLGLEVYALEFRYFKEESGMEILVPNVHGGKKRVASTPLPLWTEKRFFEDAEKRVDTETLQTLHKLYDFSNQLGELEWGIGKTIGTFKVSLVFKGEPIRFCVISPLKDWSWFAFKQMVQKGVNKTLIQEYLRKLNSLGFKFDEAKDAEGYPKLDASILNDNEKLLAFEKYTTELKEKLKA